MDAFARNFMEAVQFENWLRFYFVEDAGSSPDHAGGEGADCDAVINVPPSVSERTMGGFAGAGIFLEALQGRGVSMERSLGAVRAWMCARSGMDGDEFERRMAALSDDAGIRRELDFFQGWVQDLADGTEVLPGGRDGGDEVPVPFSEWRSAYGAWRAERG